MNQTEFTIRVFNQQGISQRNADGYMDATAMCKANGKKFNDYWRNKSTQEFVEALATDAGIPASGLVEVRKGGTSAEQGTYVHPRIATHLAQWCSAKFAVAVSGWVLDILTTGKAEILPPASPQPSDPILALLESARTTYLLQIEQAKKLTAVEAKVDTIQATADRALREAVASQKTADNQYGYFTVLAYAKRTGRNLSVGEASRVGKCLSDRLRAIGGQPQRISDPRFGFVNLYPENMLIEHFQD